MSSLFLLPLFSLISIFSLSSAYSTTLSLSPTAAAPPLSNPWQKLNNLAAASSTRAHLLKHPNTNISSAAAAAAAAAAATEVPLFPRGYGGYSISLSFGTPPQKLSFVMDTGSSLVWFPCTQRYACNSCNFVNVNPSNISTFIPKSSSSTMIIGCKNPKCRWIFPDVSCKNNCDKNSTTCAEFCPPYIIQYGLGSTTGLLLSETLVFPEKSVENFFVGCSIFSTRQPAGIAGFGRGSESLPAQMGLKRFSYCLVSHRFDDAPVSSDLVLDGAAAAAAQYTPFRKNPTSSNPAFRYYYYVTLRRITVGGVHVKAPYKSLVADSGGDGGTIVDSGTTFTFMENQVFEPVAEEFEKQMVGWENYSRAFDVENRSGLRPCFSIPDDGGDSFSLPELSFHFKGSAEMVLPLADYFSFLEDSVVCMTIVTNNATRVGLGSGPAIILGNYQQQNFFMEYDLENERLGFKKQLCK